jgi:hypothetical protein
VWARVHEIVLFVHSGLRWVVLALALLVVVRAAVSYKKRRAWEPADERAHAGFVGILDLQFTLGLLLYLFLSPFPRAFFSGLPGSMKVSELRFFGIEHIVMMLVAIGVAHVGRKLSKRREGAARHRLVFWTALVPLLLAFSAVPWPFSHVKRPLLRASLSLQVETPKPVPICPPLYASRCATCHGASGAGDGVLSASLSPKPRSFLDATWQRSTNDERLARIIREGGRSEGLSPLMPAHSDLSDDSVRSLVGCIRSFADR